MITTAVETEPSLLRKQVLEAARGYRASWIRLAQFLFTIHKDKHYKSWGYLAFETYCMKELFLKQATVGKLVKSYEFLEREEPSLVRQNLSEENAGSARPAPNYESVNLLRLARNNKDIAAGDFSDLREAVIEKVEEPKEVRDRLKKILDEKKPAPSAEETDNLRTAKIKRVVALLKGSQLELSKDQLIPKYLVQQMQELIAKLEDQISE
ncbi:MAG: hypothetical protein A2Z83_04175 [Omnitrophica bacterium GWA2_52_8]|nr:MAG: hypothetical protein A2Z83_04175 [Omnitrophica bacterium GWA2_52_8]